MTAARDSRIPRTIPFLLAICLCSLPAYGKYSRGNGTADHLILLGETPEDHDKHFILAADLDLNPNLPRRKVFHKAVIAPTPFWPRGTPFAGVSDGNNHTISHLTISGDTYLGLFGENNVVAYTFSCCPRGRKGNAE